MKKFVVNVMIAFSFCSMHAMQDDDAIQLGDDIETILQVQDPVKFAALAQQLATRSDQKIHLARRGPKKNQLSTEQELELLETSMSNVAELNNGVLTELNTLNDEALKRWNKERKKGCGKTIGWFLSAATVLTIEGFILFSDFKTETKVATGVPLVTTAFGMALKFLDDTRKVFKNTHINEKLDAQLKKSKTVQETKKELNKEIERLQKQIRREKKEDLSTTTKSSKKKKRSKKETDSESDE